jgi:hypothetical protein
MSAIYQMQSSKTSPVFILDHQFVNCSTKLQANPTSSLCQKYENSNSFLPNSWTCFLFKINTCWPRSQTKCVTCSTQEWKAFSSICWNIPSIRRFRPNFSLKPKSLLLNILLLLYGDSVLLLLTFVPQCLIQPLQHLIDVDHTEVKQNDIKEETLCSNTIGTTNEFI